MMSALSLQSIGCCKVVTSRMQVYSYESCLCSDRLRTSVNVIGDAFGAGIVHHLCRYELAKSDADHKYARDEIGTTHGTEFCLLNFLRHLATLLGTFMSSTELSEK